MMNFTNDEMNLMCIYSAGSSRTGLMQKLTEMKMYLERDEVQLLSLTESTLSLYEDAKCGRTLDYGCTEILRYAAEMPLHR